MGAGLAVDAGDARITRVGALLRRTSLDELPEPVERAARRDVDDRAAADRARRRSPTTPSASAGASRSSPGLTGWAQVNGRASLPWSERIELDLYYIEHRSLALDARILARTVRVLLDGGGLYRGDDGRLGRPRDVAPRGEQEEQRQHDRAAHAPLADLVQREDLAVGQVGAEAEAEERRGRASRGACLGVGREQRAEDRRRSRSAPSSATGMPSDLRVDRRLHRLAGVALRVEQTTLKPA